MYNSGQGIAHSKSGETLETNDGGKNWFLIEANDELLISGQPLWSAEIYCSVMATIDGGTTWTPYLQEQQEHFCLVYFKDNNTGWNIAGDFLNKVVSDINEYLNNDDIESLLDNPHQCTEYFTNIDSGWALGWCIGNFKNLKGISVE